jgi:hypothetical protein
MDFYDDEWSQTDYSEFGDEMERLERFQEEFAERSDDEWSYAPSE